MPDKETVLSPANSDVIRVKDSDLGATYIEFPPDTFFMESLARNSQFRAGVAYIPVQRFVNGAEVSHLYEIQPGVPQAKHVAGPLAAPDGSTDITIFGSALDSKGILYLCAFNRNSILVLDLKTLPPGEAQETAESNDSNNKAAVWKCQNEIRKICAPNDVSIDHNDESILYVAGGTFQYLGFGLFLPFANAARGKVYKISLKDNKHTTKVQLSGLNTLAGIEVFGDNIYVAQLFDLFKQSEKGGKYSVVWKGNDGQGNVWLADNVDTFLSSNTTNKCAICPAYSTVSETLVNKVLSRSFLSSSAIFGAQILTSFRQGERLRKAIQDPEVSLSFSYTYIKEGKDPEPIRLIFFPPNTTAVEDTPKWVAHLEIDLAETRAQHPPRNIYDRTNTDKVLGQRHYFNEQVTHAAQIRDEQTGRSYVACINFEQPRILLLDDSKFQQIITEKTASVAPAAAS